MNFLSHHIHDGVEIISFSLDFHDGVLWYGTVSLTKYQFNTSSLIYILQLYLSHYVLGNDYNVQYTRFKYFFALRPGT